MYFVKVFDYNYNSGYFEDLHNNFDYNTMVFFFIIIINVLYYITYLDANYKVIVFYNLLFN